jgi:ribosome-binding factor A
MPVRTLSLSVLIILLAASQIPAQTVLTAKWKQGVKLNYVIEDNYTSKSMVKDAVFELSQSLILDTAWHVKSVGTKGEAEIVVTIERVQFTADGKGAAAFIQKLRFDSKDQEEPVSTPVLAALRRFAGQEIEVAIDERGHVSKFELSGTLNEHLADNTTRELAGLFGDVFTAIGIRHRLTNWLVAFPKEPVSKSETWRHEQISRFGPLIDCVHSCTFAGAVVRDGQALFRINMNPKLKMRADDATEPRAKITQKITEQKGEGVAYFDERTGHIVEVVLSQHAVLESFAKMTLDTKTTAKLHVDRNR